MLTSYLNRLHFMTDNIAYLLLGGNMGDRAALLAQAATLITEQLGTVIKKSAVYETAAWGNEALPGYLNQALMVSTKLSAPETLKVIQEIEHILGRQRIEKWGSRTMDIDIIFFNEDIITQEGLLIPHPHMQERNFVLVPLQEIAPTYIHPVSGLSITELQQRSKDHLKVYALPGN